MIGCIVGPILCMANPREGIGEPDLRQIESGAKIFKSRKGTESLDQDARTVIGRWFDGSKKVGVEEVVVVSPGLLSRWLGFQGLSIEESRNAWQRFWKQSQGKTLLFVRLSRLDFVDWHDGDTPQSAHPEALDQVKFFFNEGGVEWKAASVVKIQDLQDRSPQLVLRDRWDEVIASQLAWPGMPTQFPLVSEIRWGKNRRVGYLVDYPGAFVPFKKLGLKVQESDRTRLFNLKFPKN